ncbi:hypothetical protein HHI36_014610 [Cryptolaemus montrouzieri]|uniref:Uncharacterized protein n=1 Tax=Cryptolaemus montrouzieri TaxID=559131 RepID=A0ABD2N331_9CUCU
MTCILLGHGSLEKHVRIIENATGLCAEEPKKKKERSCCLHKNAQLSSLQDAKKSARKEMTHGARNTCPAKLPVLCLDERRIRYGGPRCNVMICYAYHLLGFGLSRALDFVSPLISFQ